MSEIAIYLLTGKLIIFLSQKFPKNSLPFIGDRLFREGKLLNELFSCDLCLGFWVYSILAFLFNINMFSEWVQIPIITAFMTGAVATFVMHLMSVGWNSKFQNFIVE